MSRKPVSRYIKFGVFQAHRFFLGVDDGGIRGNNKRSDSYTAPPWKIVISRKAQELHVMNAIHFMHIFH